MPSELIAAVAIRAATEGGRAATLSYRVPEPLRPLVQPGQLVWVPLRRQQVQGVVLDLFAPADDVAERDLRDVSDIGDPEATLTPAGLQLARWVARTYRASLYEVLALLLPPGAAQQAEITWRPTSLGERAELGGLPVRERGVLYYLRQHGETSERALRKELRGTDGELLAAYADLHERGLLARGAAITAPRAQPRLVRLVRLLLPAHELDGALAELERAPKQAAALRWLAAFVAERAEADDQPPPPVPLATVAESSGTDSAALRALQRRGYVAFEHVEVRRDPLAGDGVPPDVPPPLTAFQRAALGPILDALDFETRRHETRDKETSETRDARHETRDKETSNATVSASAEAFHVSRLASPPLLVSGSPSPSLSFPRNELPQSNVFLLHGVTGSGKTEVYLRAIGRALRLGRQVLVLVPEIALTAQLVRRFAARFPGQVAVLHSGLSLGQRYDEWRRLRRGEATIAIGSRSAVFAPLPRLGLIIVDEEHEPTYKHDAAPRYHARDAALQLAAITGSVAILGSATPSVESYHAAAEGRYRLLEMRERVSAAPSVNGLPRSQSLPLPPVRIIDMRREIQTGNRSIFSRPLQEALDAALARNEQAILFLNRRGAASFVMCRDCGHVLSCGVCSGPLTVHYEQEAQDVRREAPEDATTSRLTPYASLLICHSCNHRQLMPLVCPQCLSTRIKAFGVGTQRVEEEVLRLFPGARPLRWDKDSASRRGSHQRLLDTFLRHEADVLVGTQMIAKGLDLPLVSLVGVVAADTGLHLPDFRSGERSFQLLTQVAGRAGRRTAGAQVIMQSYVPEHYALQAAREHDYAAFYTQEIAFRQQTGYPPFGRLVRFVYSSGSDDRCQREARELAQRLSALLNAHPDSDLCGIIGPAPAFMQRVRGRFRWHLLLRAPAPAPLLDALGPIPGWMIDVDPVNVL